ncbi:MAG TPA: hypothetical protein VI431_08985 [Candidatus Acidoferrum sp.]
MAEGKKDTLSTLRAELAYLELGAYRSPQQASWRPQFIFEDSPTCLNYRNFGKRLPCSECALIDFVPNGSKQKQFPCRYIPLDESGHTLDFLYRTATEDEAHAIVAKWLRTTIAQLEKQEFPSRDLEKSADTPVLTETH